MKLKRLSALMMAGVLVIPTTFASATTNDSSSEENGSPKEGSYAEKSEVVYANLNANGEQKEMYVVNNFKVDQPGKMVDYGPYTNVENLTNLKVMKLNDNQVKFNASEDQFYYQGNLKGQALPWDIKVSYKLNGQSLSPEELLGKDGKLEIHIETKENEDADSSFFENYMLQISLPFDSEIYQNIKTEKGMVASSGKNKQVTFTVMPEKEESFVVKADVKDLEMESIEITGMPSSMSVDEPDSDEMTEDMKSLSDATAEINDGVGELNDGIAELNNGAKDLQEGSGEYKKGIHELDNGSSDLIEGSKGIDTALEDMSQSLQDGSDDNNSGNLADLQNGLKEIANGLKETEDGLSDLKNNYSEAFSALDQSINKIPNISPNDIQELKQSEINPEVKKKLVQSYEKTQEMKKTYADNIKAFHAVEPTLNGVKESLTEMRTNLETMVKSLENSNLNKSMKQLQQGLSELSTKYKEFHSGLVDYTDGVSELSSSYDKLHGGITDLTDGTSELENGVSELHEGTNELAESTSDLPDEMQNEIDNMMNEYDKSDFNPVSFVSSKNEKVSSVQFVIKTESIKKDDEVEENEQPEEEEKGFWDRLWDLFK
ncbi:X-X-X-Leu-X-X-Gly heptad repeat-containing protein [Salinibacillus kushneri]|uniref:X-X-X-Leu-X-X-Gly heptad repeat-containing protein n=2 Tax=Salinibacillus kushneri TaxID=237682 RepID=A0A1I0F7T1_9BACI|nr:hypothetical protein [Salinibacillus kushneri]SET53787.1 X-X-X-Leu-X-X-Gly heptad repeat-containing protein [Salinibacillus kushneri]